MKSKLFLSTSSREDLSHKKHSNLRVRIRNRPKKVLKYKKSHLIPSPSPLSPHHPPPSSPPLPLFPHHLPPPQPQPNPPPPTHTLTPLLLEWCAVVHLPPVIFVSVAQPGKGITAKSVTCFDSSICVRGDVCDARHPGSLKTLPRQRATGVAARSMGTFHDTVCEALKQGEHGAVGDASQVTTAQQPRNTRGSRAVQKCRTHGGQRGRWLTSDQEHHGSHTVLAEIIIK